MELNKYIDHTNLNAYATKNDIKKLCEEAKEHKFKSVCVVVGPEGGFDRVEVEAASEHGFHTVSLGKRILRCETAPGCAICAILYHTDNL